MSGNCTVKGDPLMLSHMLENLFVNAIKYSLKGSVIRLVLKEDHLILSNTMEQPITTGGVMEAICKGRRSKNRQERKRNRIEHRAGDHADIWLPRKFKNRRR